MTYQGTEHFEFRDPTRVKVVELNQERGKQNPKSRQNAKKGKQRCDQVDLEVGFAQETCRDTREQKEKPRGVVFPCKIMKECKLPIESQPNEGKCEQRQKVPHRKLS